MTEPGRVPGLIVVLNGPSSSGKTSLARALQARWSGPLLLVGLDMMIGMVPFAYSGQGAKAAEGYRLVADLEDGLPVVRHEIGPYGRRLNRHLAELAARLAADGFDVVVDHVIQDDQTLRELIEFCEPTALIGVTCELKVLERREAARGDRMIGLARDQAAKVHAGWRPYNLTLDTTDATPEQLAERMIRLVSSLQAKDAAV